MELNLEKKVKISCVSASLIECINKKLFGDIFTVIDASILDRDSKKAVKSLISQSFTRRTGEVLSSLNNLKEG